MKENIDEEISRVISSKIYEPEEYKIAIEKALYTNEKKLKNSHFYKMIVAICFSLVILSSVAYAGYTIIKNVFNNRKGVETAINNNYIMDGLQEYQESNGVSVKINNMLIDDYNLDISFNVKFNENSKLYNSNLEYVKSFRFEKMIILDEKNNILSYTENKDILNDFIEKNKLDIKIEQFSKNYNNVSISTEIRNKENNQSDLIYNMTSYEHKYPKSKGIIIYIENIVINKDTVINGSWQIKQKIDEKFYNRENIQYRSDTENYKNINNLEVTTYATGTNISFKIEIDAENERKELQKILSEISGQANIENNDYLNKSNEGLSSTWLNEKEKFYNEISNIYIENANGIKFYSTESMNENKKMLISDNKENLTYSNTIDMTIYDCTNEITLHFIYQNKEYNIKLTI